MMQILNSKFSYVTLPSSVILTFIPTERYYVRDTVVTFSINQYTSPGFLSFTYPQKHDKPADEIQTLSYYDIVPERTTEFFLRDYETRMNRVKHQLHEYVDIDLPIVDDGGDW